MEKINNYEMYKFNITERLFNPAEAIGNEETVLSEFRGRAKDIAKVLLLVSGLTFGEGVIRQTSAQEKEQDTAITIIEKKDEIALDEFINLSEEGQINYLESTISEHNLHNEDEELNFKIAQKITNLKDSLDKKFDITADTLLKEKINQAFLMTHHFILENSISWKGLNELTVWNGDGKVNVNEIISDEKNKVNEGDKTKLFLEDGQEGKLTKEFVNRIKKTSGTDLAKIKKIYDLVAQEIPRYNWYHKEGEMGEHGYQTFEQLLKNKAGICTEKNALLVYALKKVGIDAVLVMSGNHIFAKAITQEGNLNIDVTLSDPFTMLEPSSVAVEEFYIGGSLFDNLPDYIKKYGIKWNDDGLHFVSIPLNFDENIEYVAKKEGLEVEKIKEIALRAIDNKPHPIYNVVKKNVITPSSAGKYAADLFPNVIDK